MGSGDRFGVERQVVLLMADMVHYANISAEMTPAEICAFLSLYHNNIRTIIDDESFQPLDVEPTGGDGTVIIFDKRPGEEASGICTRALLAAMRLAAAISDCCLVPTRMGLMLGHIIESRLDARTMKCGSCFAVANRLEELSGYFGTHFLMDREIARYQRGFDDYVINIGKVSLTSVPHPLNLFTIYSPGSPAVPGDVDRQKLKELIRRKNQAMDFFSGNLQLGLLPDFPRVREELMEVQTHFKELTGSIDIATGRILEYIREMPRPAVNFKTRGMELMEKKRDSLGERLFHLSRELLRAMSPEFYEALVEDTNWERFFKLEWFHEGETIIEVGAEADGIYYIDNGRAETYSADGRLLSIMEAGDVFGEMAYFGNEKRRTATVRAATEVVVRRITNEDFEKLPVIVKIFEKIARTRKEKMAAAQPRKTDRHF